MKKTTKKPKSKTPKTVAMISLGCAKNLVDGEEMLGRLGMAGYMLGASPEDADVLIVNTCAFVGPARAEARRTLRQAAEWRRSGAVRMLVVTGCYPQRDGEALRRMFPEIDALAGAGAAPHIAEMIEGGIDALGPPDHLMDANTPRLLATAPWMAYLKVAEGCSNRCAYCVIPDLRGPHRSRLMADVVAEAKALAEGGAKELVLVSQDTTAYGADRPGGENLAGLLRKLDRIPGLRWIRVMYAHPARVTDELLEAMAESKRVVPYIDIPLQHVHGDVLKRMGRPGDEEKTMALLNRIRKAIPGVCIRTTFIVGFPGETEKEFEALCRFVKKARFDRAGVFAYSRETGTPAAKLPGQISAAEKRARRDKLMTLQQKISQEINDSFIGREFDVLVEDYEGEVCLGRTVRDAPEVDGLFELRGFDGEPGSFVRAVVAAASPYDLFGTVAASREQN